MEIPGKALEADRNSSAEAPGGSLSGVLSRVASLAAVE